MEIHAGALHHVLAICQERGIHRAVPEAFDQLFQKAIQAGDGQADFAALHRFMRPA
ncbi:hypothetical protein [Myxococcus sp. RHSTA-1-4]|uniref:imine reductase family protein n=1 Tax=Myxococcus sp. RHSTA-1-4 TaxID=2874601 RepID=UPI001CC0A2B2|nr:hypothetical protein [Myxococcus sp. RHSTA-1-4]MBZ4422664.1 hypothetical protein [Myxococcus sp. RHSTA-1-4]